MIPLEIWRRPSNSTRRTGYWQLVQPPTGPPYGYSSSAQQSLAHEAKRARLALADLERRAILSAPVIRLPAEADYVFPKHNDLFAHGRDVGLVTTLLATGHTPRIWCSVTAHTYGPTSNLREGADYVVVELSPLEWEVRVLVDIPTDWVVSAAPMRDAGHVSVVCVRGGERRDTRALWQTRT